MPSPNSTFTELVTTTHRKHKKGFKDNLSERNALLKRIYKKGNYRTEDGGLTIVEPLDYAANSTYQRYSDWDLLNIQQSDVLSAAEFSWKQIAIHVVASGRELRINSGDAQIEKLVASRIKNAYRTFDNNFSSDMYSDGSLSNQIGGLQHIIADTNTNTVGGISASTWSFWRNTVFDLSDAGVTISATTIENDVMLPLWLSIDRGQGDCPDLILFDTVYFTHFEKSQTSLKRYASSSDVQAGILSLKYKSADVVNDTSASGIPASHGYFINTNYVKLVVHKDADLDEMEKKEPVNQDGEVVPILWMGNMTVSNRKMQGVIHA
ncbi:MAG: phage major capsid protein [Cetobacterium sp.]